MKSLIIYASIFVIGILLLLITHFSHSNVLLNTIGFCASGLSLLALLFTNWADTIYLERKR